MSFIAGSFTSLNNSLNPFASSTTASAPPDSWPYAPAYDLAPHLNLLSPSNSPYSSFGGPGNNGSSYSYTTMLPQHDAGLFSGPSSNAMRVHQEFMNSNNSPPPSMSREYQGMVTTHSPPGGHLAGSMSEDEHQQNKQLEYVSGLSPNDKYQHEQQDYSQHSEQKSDYGMHSPPGRQMKDQVLIKSEPNNQQSYVQLPPFLN